MEKPTGEKDNVPMVKIPAGEFIMGTDVEFAVYLMNQLDKIRPHLVVDQFSWPNFYYEIPSLHVSLPSYQIDQVQVTNARYQRCVIAGECRPLENSEALPKDAPARVKWADAEAYCHWTSKRLPTEAEWEKAARGTDGRLYPWGNEWDASRITQTDEPGGQHPTGASPYGVLDMISTWPEWTTDTFRPYPSNSFELSRAVYRNASQVKAVRGGYAPVYEESILALVTNRMAYSSEESQASFRCVQGDSPAALESAVVSYRPVVPPTPTSQKVDLNNMVFVPAGEFIMGTDIITPPQYYEDFWKNAQPQHRVYLDGFYIDKYEATNSEYAEFLNTLGQSTRACAGYDCAFTQLAGFSAYPSILEYPGTPTTFRVKPGREHHPATDISWYGAQAYCAWRSKRLPTEAEWEKAARGTNGQRYPAGNIWDDRFLPTNSDAHEIGSNLSDVGPYGAVDMLGNATEWVADWFDPNYYAVSPSRNPPGPNEPVKDQTGALLKAQRSFRTYNTYLNELFGLSLRIGGAASSTLAGTGFRCAYSMNSSP
jgi:formylglycine-generating enzyme required for sulfatase activity